MTQVADPLMTTFTFTLIELISLITGILSIVLGAYAIWLTLYIKKESDSLNRETKELLFEIKTDAKIISRGVISEMEKWGDFGRNALTSSSEKRPPDGAGVSSKNGAE